MTVQSGRTLIKTKVIEKEKKKIFNTQKIDIKKKEENNDIVKISLISKEIKEDNKNENENKENIENIINIFDDTNKLIGNENDNNSIDMEDDLNQ